MNSHNTTALPTQSLKTTWNTKLCQATKWHHCQTMLPINETNRTTACWCASHNHDGIWHQLLHLAYTQPRHKFSSEMHAISLAQIPNTLFSSFTFLSSRDSSRSRACLSVSVSMSKLAAALHLPVKEWGLWWDVWNCNPALCTPRRSG